VIAIFYIEENASGVTCGPYKTRIAAQRDADKSNAIVDGGSWSVIQSPVELECVGPDHFRLKT
jgi:hypothetical protein